jgi:hypothetical protein
MPSLSKDAWIPRAGPRSRLVIGGLAWAGVYNGLWALAWAGGMRRAWTEAARAIGREAPFPAAVWAIWVAATVPIGIAVVAYAIRDGRLVRHAIIAASGVWLLIAGGTTIAFLSDGLSGSIVAADAATNLVAIGGATLVGVCAGAPNESNL